MKRLSASCTSLKVLAVSWLRQIRWQNYEWLWSLYIEGKNLLPGAAHLLPRGLKTRDFQLTLIATFPYHVKGRKKSSTPLQVQNLLGLEWPRHMLHQLSSAEPQSHNY
ncbi:hypothetical protein BDZ45DRAFT_752031 [Acephala macrosclerotiorum]|nr:hypothetical protein BDZ45DRAFT_752031 [Acephala macrosclerotiorum]